MAVEIRLPEIKVDSSDSFQNSLTYVGIIFYGSEKPIEAIISGNYPKVYSGYKLSHTLDSGKSP
jgi:hypothetical protein